MRAIADEGSFTAAALSLGYSQPAISQMVRRLETRTGTTLVERVGRSVRLTEAGAVLARHAGPVLSALDAAEEEVAAIAGLRAGRVRLMAFPSSSATLVPRALALVKERYPEIKVSFTEAEPPESLAALRAGECDLAVAFAYEGTDLGRGEEDLDAFVTQLLLDDEVRLALPKDHPLAGQEVAELAALYDDRRLLIVGHTDALGEAAYNQYLSRRRAEVVKDFLVESFGIEETRLAIEGKGEEQPIASNATQDGRRANRRVEILLLN